MQKLILAVFVLLCGCAPVQPGVAPAKLEQVRAEDSGIVFGTIGADSESPLTLQELRYRAKGGRAPGRFFFQRDEFIRMSTDLDDGKSKVKLFSVRLPAGEYEIFDVAFNTRIGPGASTFTAKPQFSVPFSVAKGQATYLGEFIAHPTMAKNLFGLLVPESGYFVVSDKLDRDFGLLVNKKIADTSTKTIRSVPEPSAMGSSYFKSADGTTGVKKEPASSTGPVSDKLVSARSAGVVAVNPTSDQRDAREIAKNSQVRFLKYRQGIAYYVIHVSSEGADYTFPVRLSDVGGITLPATDSAIGFVHYIQQALDNGTFVKAE